MRNDDPPHNIPSANGASSVSASLLAPSSPLTGSPRTRRTRTRRPHHTDDSGAPRRSWIRNPMTIGVVFVCVLAVVVLAVISTTSKKGGLGKNASNMAVVVNTWPFVNATKKAYEVLAANGGSGRAIDAVVAGCTVCEEEQCDGTVGFGGSPDSTGETTLDALVVDGETHAAGAVGYLRQIRNAIGVARAVMDHSSETLLVGDGATAFAEMMGFPKQSLSTPRSEAIFKDWKENNCQPNYWRNVVDQDSKCPPYAPITIAPGSANQPAANKEISKTNHDTIGLVALDVNGTIAAGTSSNGANHKIAGRVGDAPIVGAGAYADSQVGAAVATGDGDVMMRFLPTYQAVENMRHGMDPMTACQEALGRIGKFYPDFQGALVCVSHTGAIGAAAWGWTFQYSFASPMTGGTPRVVTVPPMN